jgi:hypothetical protein
MSITEKNIQSEIMLALSGEGCLIFRNNSGSYKTPGGGYVKYGVGNPGGSDLIGVCDGGRFLAVEVKTNKGRPSQAQLNFIKLTNSKGGVSFIARSAEEAVRKLKELTE